MGKLKGKLKTGNAQSHTQAVSAQRLAQALAAELDAGSWGDIDPYWISCVASGKVGEDDDAEIRAMAELLDRVAARLSAAPPDSHRLDEPQLAAQPELPVRHLLPARLRRQAAKLRAQQAVADKRRARQPSQ